DSGVAFIRANNLKDGKLTWQDMRYIDLDLHKVLKSGHLKTGDILVTTRGDVGITAYVTEEFNNANINAQICLLRTGDDLAKQYLFYSLQTAKSKNQFTQLQTGSALKQLPKGKLALLVIGVPSKDEQERIAGFLTMVDERVVAMSKKVELLQQYKKGVMQKIFSQKLRFKDENGQNYPDWGEKDIKQCTSFIKDGTHGTHVDTPESPYFLLSAKNIKQGVVIYNANDRTISEDEFNLISKNYTLQENDVLMSIVGTIGNIALWNKSLSKIAFQRSVAFLRFEKINPNYVFQLFSTRYFQNELKRRTVISAQPGIYLGDIAKIIIPIPLGEEQQKIADFLTSLDDKINLEKTRLEQAKLFKKSLLQRMFV
ncbi:MAG: restriction endonuclease subunit S, partial [Candidatus Saccharimonadales bacterium]